MPSAETILRGITRASSERVVQRNRWRRQRGNDRTVRILVPMDSASDGMSGDVSDDVSGVGGSAGTGLASGALVAPEGAVAALREQLNAANAAAERTQTDRADERARAEAALAGERARGDLLRQEFDRMRQVEVARRALGLLARLMGAWRGE